VWDDAREQNFTYEERVKRQYDPRDSDGKRVTFSGVVKAVKPSFIFIQPPDGFDVISSTTVIKGVPVQRGDNVEFNLTFSAKGPFAENLQLSI
jgi:cold shock CspA family protein